MWNILGLLALLWPAVATAGDGKLLLNAATATQLAALDGVGEDAAASIVELRSERGRLGSVEELRILHDLDEMALDALRRSVAVEIELPVGSSRAYGSAAEVLAEFAHEPTIQQVHAWATEYTNVSPRMVARWMAASRTFAALPQVTLEYRLKDGWDQDFNYFDEFGDELQTADQEPFAVLDDAGQDQDVQYLVRARWELSELIMSSERIRIISEAQDVVKLRDKVLSDVTRLYFERRRLQAESLLSPRSDVLAQVKDQLKLLEFTANIDALTGGAFSAALSRATPLRSSATAPGAPVPSAPAPSAPSPAPSGGGIDL